MSQELKSTVICHFFNEEYLLPFWLQHHRPIFDHGIMIDYASTDKSKEIIKQYCPTWEIRPSRNKDFSPEECDKEIMEIEKTLTGIKMVLNVTELLVPLKPLKDYFPQGVQKVYKVGMINILNDKTTTPTTPQEFYEGMRIALDVDNTWKWRFIHSYPSGEYGVGRHVTSLPAEPVEDIHILSIRFYPWNEQIAARKLQIQHKIPKEDINRGMATHHVTTREKLEEQYKSFVQQAQGLQPFDKLYPNIWNWLQKMYIAKKGGGKNTRGRRTRGRRRRGGRRMSKRV